MSASLRVTIKWQKLEGDMQAVLQLWVCRQFLPPSFLQQCHNFEDKKLQKIKITLIAHITLTENMEFCKWLGNQCICLCLGYFLEF